MTVLAIDPGPTESAFVRWDGMKILDKGKIGNLDLLGCLSSEAARPPFLAIEMIACYGMAVGKEVFETCVWIGRFSERWIDTVKNEDAVTRIKRGEVKMHLCHSMKAKDGNIRQALIDRLGAPGTKKAPGVTFGVSGDVWAALGVAVTFWDRLQDGAL